jgi:hypothetical protein
MSRWYKAAIACARAFAVSWFAIPEYYYLITWWSGRGGRPGAADQGN